MNKLTTMLILAGMFTVSHAADVYDVNTAPQTAPAGYYDPNAQDPNQAVQQIPEGANVVRTTEYQRDPNTVTQPYTYTEPTANMWNLTPAQIINIKRKYETQTRAMAQDVNPAKCVQTSVVASNSPGAPVPVIRLDSRNVANIVLTDIAGNPWPYDDIVSNSNVSVIENKEDMDSANFSIAPGDTPYPQGNITVKLRDNPVPMVFSYISNQREVDCLLTVQIDRPYSGAKSSNNYVGAASYGALDTSLNSTLYGVAPKDSKALVSSDPSVQAWKLSNGEVVIRTQYKLMSPPYKGVMTSPDGTLVYRTQYAPRYNYINKDVTGSFTVK